MEEWVDEVNRLLGGEQRRESPKRHPKEGPKRATRGHKRTISSVSPLFSIAEMDLSAETIGMRGAPTLAQWLTPMRSPPRPPQENDTGNRQWSFTDASHQHLSKDPLDVPPVKWRRYYQPPSPPLVPPHPSRPTADDVPADLESRPSSLLPSYLTYSPPTQLPAHIRPISAHMPTVVFRPPTVQSMACEIEST